MGEFYFVDGHVEVWTNQGNIFLVSREDVDLVANQLWYKTKNGYMVRTVKAGGCKKKMIYLHKVIAERVYGNIPPAYQVDHIDGDKLDNRRQNLRLATVSENGFNRGANKNNTSGYKGVTWHKVAEKWSSKIEINFVTKNLGLFDDPIVAAQVYDVAAKMYHGKFARLNFSNPLDKRLDDC